MANRPPSYRLKILNKNLNTKCNDAGAGWVNKDGSISLVIAPGILLQESSNLVITLFPIMEKE